MRKVETDNVLNDVVNSPTHYNHKGVECINAIEAFLTPEEFKGYLKGNMMKYLWRHPYKGKPIEDLNKMEWYRNKLLTKLE